MAQPSLARNPVSLVGAWLTTLSAFAFVVYYAVEWFGLIVSPYAGLFGFVLVPAVFLTGLLLIPIGIWREGRRRRRGAGAWVWPAIDLNRPHVRRVTLVVALLTLVNLSIVALAGFGAVHYMETNEFCGLVCHEPMRPEFTAHQTAPHASVDCVRCHISPGALGFARAKMNGARQAYEMLTGTFQRPIPSAPARNIPVAAETCLRCHSRGRPQPDKVQVTHEYADDEANSDTPTEILLYTARNHWHARADVRVEYVTADPKREKIPYLKVTRPDGSTDEYFADGVTSMPQGERRLMDCLDCHSRPAHTFAPSAERAVDDAITNGWIKRSVPFVRREVVAALKQPYATDAAAEAGIRQRLSEFYKSHAAPASDVEQTINTALLLYRTNVFPQMKVTWGTYLDQNGHTDVTGCLRCHSDEHSTKGGKVLKNDCELCHKEKEQ